MFQRNSFLTSKLCILIEQKKSCFQQNNLLIFVLTKTYIFLHRKFEYTEFIQKSNSVTPHALCVQALCVTLSVSIAVYVNPNDLIYSNLHNEEQKNVSRFFSSWKLSVNMKKYRNLLIHLLFSGVNGFNECSYVFRNNLPFPLIKMKTSSGSLQ